jgi:hypothetical protein
MQTSNAFAEVDLSWHAVILDWLVTHGFSSIAQAGRNKPNFCDRWLGFRPKICDGKPLAIACVAGRSPAIFVCAVEASSNETLCFDTFAAALISSHSN